MLLHFTLALVATAALRVADRMPDNLAAAENAPAPVKLLLRALATTLRVDALPAAAGRTTACSSAQVVSVEHLYVYNPNNHACTRNCANGRHHGARGCCAS